MRFACATTVAALFVLFATAQENKTVVFNSAKDNGDGISKSIYLYPQFTNGKALFTNRTEATGRFNYNCLTNNVAFINEKGDTLGIANPELIDKVVIQTDTFCHFKEVFLRQLTHFSTYNLFAKPTMAYADSEKKGAYGTYSGVSSSENVSTVTDGRSNFRTIDADENIVYRFTVAYYIADKFGNFSPATKKGIYDVLGKNEKEIKAFVKEHDTNFSKQADLAALLQYVQSLKK